MALGLRDVPWADYDLQRLRYHREDGGLIPYDLSVDGELQAPRARLDPDFLRAGKEDPYFVQVVRSSKNRGGELEHLLHPDVFYDHEGFRAGASRDSQEQHVQKVTLSLKAAGPDYSERSWPIIGALRRLPLPLPRGLRPF